MASQPSMPITIADTQAQSDFPELMRRTRAGREHFIITKDGTPSVAIISISEYEELMQERERREQRLHQFEKLARDIGAEAKRQGLSEEDLLAELEKDKAAVYQRYYGKSNDQ